MDPTRYQYQPWYIKLWRRRWFLAYYLLAGWKTFTWLLRGRPQNQWIDDATGEVAWRDTRWETFLLIWQLALAEAEIKMNWLYDFEEVLDDLEKQL